jgi:hypothetical protein
VVQALGVALVIIAFCYVNWFPAVNVDHKPYWITTLTLLGVCAVLVVVWLLFRFMPLLWVAAVTAFLTAVMGIIWGIAAANSNGGHGPEAGSPPSTATTTVVAPATTAASTSAAPVTCTTWKMTSSTPSNGNWVADGVPAIQQAKTNKQARAAIQGWVNKIKGSPSMLAGASTYLLHKQANPDELVSNGCASKQAVSLVNEVSVALALSDVSPAQAPADGYNSGTSNGAVVANSAPGISGNRKAVKVMAKDGTTVWVMARCGNPVTKTPPPVPTKPPTHTTTPPASTCTPTPGVESCGKHASYAPKPTGGNVVTPPPGGYIDRSGHPHTSSYVPPPNTNPTPGKTDSGRGATNTAPASSVPHPSATATVPQTVSPTTNPVAPPPAGG